ncbi:MAG: signal peptidase I [Blastocatellia bacterium]|nr:signal peptidase I [Blastocatellia bacterium]
MHDPENVLNPLEVVTTSAHLSGALLENTQTNGTGSKPLQEIPLASFHPLSTAPELPNGTNGLPMNGVHPEPVESLEPPSVPQIFVVNNSEAPEKIGQVELPSGQPDEEDLLTSTETVVTYQSHPALSPATPPMFTGLASTESVVEYATDEVAGPSNFASAEPWAESPDDILPEPAIVTAPATAAPVYKPIYTVERPELLAGLTLEDDPQIQVSEPIPPPGRWRSWLSEGFLLGRDFFFAAVVAVLIVLFVVQPVKVEGTSMLPRLHDGERIFINKFIYQMESIQRGDIVVFWYPKDPSKSFIKRVIGLPGDEVQLVSGKLRINGKPINENYLSKDYTTIAAPSHTWVVEPHHYFVMGDNRDASNDSRSWGLVPEKYIYGKAIYRYWPIDDAGSLDDNIKALKELKTIPTISEE